MQETDSDTYAGADNTSSNHQPWGSRHYAHRPASPASQTFRPISPRFETSDEETAQHRPTMQSKIDPESQLQHPPYNTSNSRPRVISQALSAETGQRPSAASSSSSSSIENCHPTEFGQCEQSDEHGMPYHSSQFAAFSEQPLLSGVGSMESIAGNDSSISNHDPPDFASQHIQLRKKCLELDGDRRHWNKLFSLVTVQVQHTQMEPAPTASTLSRQITAFYEQLAHPTNVALKLPDNKMIRKEIVFILKDESLEPDDKTALIAETVDALYGGFGWGINTGNLDSGYQGNTPSFPTPTSTSQPLQPIERRPSTTLAPKKKRSILIGEVDGSTSPPPKRRRTAKNPKRLPRIPIDNSESQPSPPQRSANSREINCREAGCNKFLSSSITMRRHYLSHYPVEVWFCPFSTSETPCIHWSSRRDNMKLHLENRHRDVTNDGIENAKQILDDYYLEIIVYFGHLRCPFCPEQYSNSTECLDHMIEHHYKVGMSAELPFTDLRKKKYDKKYICTYIKGLVKEEVRRRQLKLKAKPRPNNQDNDDDYDSNDDDDDDDDEGGPFHGGDANGHERHSADPSDESRDYQGGGFSQGPNERGMEPGPLDGRGMSRFHVNTEPSVSSRLPFKHPNSWNCLIKEYELGRGGFGVVYKVRCKNTNEIYARKVVLSPPSPSSATSSEVDILKNLKHSHIIKLVASGNLGLFLWLLMSPVAKSDLAVYLHQVGSEPRSLCSFNAPEKQPLCVWIGCLSSALAYLHENSVIHGDIKPKNILISSDEVVYITDFGTAKYVKDPKMTARISSAITPMYCAPEIANCQSPTLDYPADVFSLGCVWAEMVTVYTGQSIQEFEKFRRSNSLDAAFHATIPRTIMWIHALPIPRKSYDGCVYDFLKTVEAMLNIDPRKRPTMSELARRFSCTCPPRESSVSQALESLQKRCHGSANNDVRSTLLFSHPATISALLPYDSPTAEGNKYAHHPKTNITFTLREGKTFSYYYENSPWLAPQWKPEDINFFRVNPRMNKSTYPETHIGLKIGKGETFLFRNEAEGITNFTMRFLEDVQRSGINNLCSLEDYVSVIQQRTVSQYVSRLWKGVLELANSLEFLHSSLHRKDKRYQSNLDLKPAYVIFDHRNGGPPEWRISDFGVSTLKSDEADIILGQDFMKEAHDYKGDFPIQCQLRKYSQACSLDCVCLELVTRTGINGLDPKAWPEGGIKSLPRSSEFGFNRPDILCRPWVRQKMMLRRTHIHCLWKRSSPNLEEPTPGMTKEVCNNSITELLCVTSDKGSLHRLLQNTALARQDWSLLNKNAITVWLTPIRNQQPSNTPMHINGPEIPSHEQEEVECSMDGERGSVAEIGRKEDLNTVRENPSIYQDMQHRLFVFRLETWLRDERGDFKSFSVTEYDPFQEGRTELHAQLLKNAVKSYSITLI